MQVRLEELVGIVEVGEHEIEAADVVHPRRIEHGARHEEGAERTAIDRAHGIEIETARACDGIGQGGMAEKLDVRIGPALAQQPQRRQRHEQIAQRAAADDQDFHARATCRKNSGEASPARVTSIQPSAENLHS